MDCGLPAAFLTGGYAMPPQVLPDRYLEHRAVVIFSAHVYEMAVRLVVPR
jgi:hypothetical protein